MIKKFQRIIQGRKTEKTRKELLSLIDKNPKDTRTRLKLGDLYVKEGKIPEAVEQFVESAEIFAKAEFHLKSIALYKQILVFQPKSITALRRIAQISYQYGLYADAYPYYEKLAKLLHKKDESGNFLEVFKEVSHLRLKDTRHKIRIFESIFPTSEGTFPYAHEALCKCAMEIGKTDNHLEDALIIARWLCSYYPEEAEGFELLVTLLHKAGHYNDLRKILKRLESLYKSSNQLEAKKDFLDKYRLQPNEVPISNDNLDSLRDSPVETTPAPAPEDQLKVKMEANIYDLLKQKSMNQPNQVEGQEGSPLERLEFNDLFDSFKEGIEGQISKDDYETHYNLGIAYQEMGLYEEAIRELQISSKDPTRQYDSLFLMASCARDLQCLEDALNFFEKALSLKNLNSDQVHGAQYEQALIYRDLGRNDEALKLFQEIEQVEGAYRETAQYIQELLGDAGG